MFFIVLGKVCQGLKPIRKGRFFCAHYYGKLKELPYICIESEIKQVFKVGFIRGIIPLINSAFRTPMHRLVKNPI